MRRQFIRSPPRGLFEIRIRARDARTGYRLRGTHAGRIQLGKRGHAHQAHHGADFELEQLEHARAALKTAMSEHAGMTRSELGLAEAAEEVQDLSGVLERDMTSSGGMELQNLVTVASLAVHAAWLRTESRGVHRRLDHPDRDDEKWLGHTVFRRGAAPRFEPKEH